MNVLDIIHKADKYIDSLETSEGFKLFERSEISPFARCFVIFNKSLIKKNDWLKIREQQLINDLNLDLYNIYQKMIINNIDWRSNKFFLQLFSFTLSSLNILNGQLNDQNMEILKKILDIDLKKVFREKQVHQGAAKSGNYSMFFAIFNIYANNYLKIDRSKQIHEWIEFNCSSINSNGFWGKENKMDYKQFQNGYHQYEIFEYLKMEKIPWDLAAKKTLLMSDRYGHFAPWPGGGACYDYDAIFILTSKFVNDISQEKVLIKTLKNIINSQNFDGGFCESKYMNNNLIIRFLDIIKHIISQPRNFRFRSLFINLNLLRNKHRNIITHWTKKHRKWDDSNAWDTFFRLSTIYRICNRLNFKEKDLFKINNFPGIG